MHTQYPCCRCVCNKNPDHALSESFWRLEQIMFWPKHSIIEKVTYGNRAFDFSWFDFRTLTYPKEEESESTKLFVLWLSVIISPYNVEDQFVPENLVFASWWRRYFLFASHKRFISNVIVKVEHKSQTEESVKQMNYKDEFMQQISSTLTASCYYMQLTFNH